MGLWGVTVADESLPKWTLGNQKLRNEIYATPAGWVHRHADGYEEVLACVRGLGVSLHIPDITGLEFINSPSDDSAGTITVSVSWNEDVTVDTGGGTPTIDIANGLEGDDANTPSATVTLTYTATGSTPNQKIFTNANVGGLDTGDILTLGGTNVVLNSGTIKDTDTTTNDASLLIPAAAIITHTVTA